MSITSGQFAAVITTFVSLSLAVASAFHILHLTQAESNAVMVVATAGVGVGLYVYALLHSWQTESYDTARATTLVTAFASSIIALLDTFGTFHFDQQQQAAVLGVASGLAMIGGFVYAYLHTSHQIKIDRAIVAATLARSRPKN